MLRPEDRLRLRDDLLQDMAHSGLITMRFVGDEPVLTITEKGRELARRHAEPGEGWPDQHGR
jgi:predicted transcriptional regulator